jgi:GNAT superfamily N-acetyltransferase
MLPEKLQEAYRNSSYVVSAWDGERLVGAGRILSDGCFNAYFPDIAVHPGYRGRGIAGKIVSKLLAECGNLYNISAVAEDRRARDFFVKCGLTDIRSACRKMTPIKR